MITVKESRRGCFHVREKLGYRLKHSPLHSNTPGLIIAGCLSRGVMNHAPGALLVI
jgi:hypothetical protein